MNTKYITDGKGESILHPYVKDGKLWDGDREVKSLGVFLFINNNDNPTAPHLLWLSLCGRDVATRGTAAVVDGAKVGLGLERLEDILSKTPAELKKYGVLSAERARCSGKRIHVTIAYETCSDMGEDMVDCSKATAKSAPFLQAIETALRHDSGIGGCSYADYDAFGEDKGAHAKGRASDDSVTIYVE